jgi:hypothetical protein
MVSFLRLAMVSGIILRNLFLPRLKMVSSDKFPIDGVRNPSYSTPSRSIAIILLETLSRGLLHKIPKNCPPVLPHESTMKSQLLSKDVGEIDVGSMACLRLRNA